MCGITYPRGTTLTREAIDNVKLGETGLYEWERSLPVSRIEEVREVMFGPKRGRAFRMIEVERPESSTKISFIISEGMTL